jgi:hypothetical protein
MNANIAILQAKTSNANATRNTDLLTPLPNAAGGKSQCNFSLTHQLSLQGSLRHAKRRVVSLYISQQLSYTFMGGYPRRCFDCTIA